MPISLFSNYFRTYFSWICGDVWMDILPSFERVELGLKMALLSDRFDVLVDKHFDGKKELTIWRPIEIRKDKGPKAKVSEWIDDNYVDFPMPDRPLPNKICFKSLWISYIDHSVIEFLRSNKQIWDRNGTKLEFNMYSSGITENGVQPIWDVFTSEIWPTFATNLRQLYFPNGDHLDNLRRHTSPTILTDLYQLVSIDTYKLFPDAIADDGPNATVGKSLSKWVHTPSKDGQPKRLVCVGFVEEVNVDWVNSFKEAFARATNSSVSYKILFAVRKTSIEPFEAVNERTREKLTLDKVPSSAACWLLKRCPISEKAAVQMENDDNLNKVTINLWANINESIGPLSPPTEEEKEKADEEKWPISHNCNLI